MIKYAGIGSRETPMPIMQHMELIGSLLGARGFELRSGQAKGADTAFEVGCKAVNGAKTIRTASIGPLVDGRRIWMDHAVMFHPVWPTLTEGAQYLMARNSAIMLGDRLNDPVSFVVCWTNGGGAVGGTGQALRIAAACGIPVFNLWFSDATDRMWQFIAEGGL